MKKKDQGVVWKQLLISVQGIVPRFRTVQLRLKDAELFATTFFSSVNGENFNN